MAKTKKTSVEPSEEKVTLEEAAIVAEEMPVTAADEVAEQPAAAEETAASFGDKVKAFGGKIKEFFVGVGVKTKDFFGNLFKKDKKTKEEKLGEMAVVAAASDGQIETVVATSLLESKLSAKEKFGRFCRSQSGWLFVLPAVILMAVFTFWPILSAFINAFKQNYSTLTGKYDGWGFENFIRVLKGDTGTGGATFIQCLVNTMVFTVISVPLSTLLALLISVALNSIKPLQKAYQTIYFLPYLTNSLAMGAVFATFFAVIGTTKNTENVGIVNQVLQGLGLLPNETFINWLGTSSPKWVISANLTIPWAKYIVVIIYEVWSGLPFKILILFSALQSVNKQYYDAAKIDGASKNTVLWKITTPMISPMISYLLVTGIMGGMKQYSAIVGLFGEQMGIDYDMGTMVGYIYRYIEDGHMGYAFAGSLILFAIIMIITAINRRISSKKVSY